MKKIIYTIGFLMFATALIKPIIALGAGQSYGEDIPWTTSNLFSKLFPEGMQTSMFESFGTKSEEDAGQDLYLKILKKNIVDPEQQAVKNLAGRYGIPPNDLEFIRAGSYQPILAKRPTMSQEDLIKKVTEIQGKFDEEYSRLQLQADLDAATSPSEVFANDDLNDSGFDLINDLRMIEDLLFLKTDPIDIGKAYDQSKDTGSGSESGPTPPPPGQTQATPAEPLPQTPQVTGTQQTQQQSTLETGQQEQCPPGMEPVPETTAGQQQLASQGIGQNSCAADSELAKALAEAEKKLASTGQKKPVCQPAGTGTSGAGGAGGAAGEGEGTGTGTQAITAAGVDFMPELPAPETPPVQPASGGTWQKDQECTDIFCIKINKYYETPKSKYNDPDTCIACHMEKIYDQLKTTMSHSVSPNKIPGNMIETPKCKNGLSASLGAVSMNVNVQFMPIQTPLNDDLILDSDLQNDYQYFCQVTAFFPAELCKRLTAPAQEIRYEDPPILQEQVAKRVMATASDTDTFTMVTEKTDQGVTNAQVQQEEAIAEMEAERSSNPNVVFYKTLVKEVDQMNMYFLNYYEILKSLHDEVPGYPKFRACYEFKNKKTCS